MAADQQSVLDRIGAASLELKELLADAHRFIRDLKIAVKEADGIAGRVVDEEVKAELAKCFDSVNAHLDGVAARTLAEYDRLTKPLIATFSDLRQIYDGTEQKIMAQQKLLDYQSVAVRRLEARIKAMDTDG